jgi:cytochrome P460
MNSTRMGTIAIVTALVSAVGGSAMSAQQAQDKYTLKVPGGLAFSEFRGYENWQLVSISHDGPNIAAILANPAMIDAYRAGVPGNGKPFPEGSMMAKVHWTPKQMETFPAATVPGTQHDVDFMVKDSKRFAATGGWGWAVFEYDSASSTFRPGTTADTPPQGNNASCGFGCHTIVKARDYVFTDYGSR